MADIIVALLWLIASLFGGTPEYSNVRTFEDGSGYAKIATDSVNISSRWGAFDSKGDTLTITVRMR